MTTHRNRNISRQVGVFKRTMGGLIQLENTKNLYRRILFSTLGESLQVQKGYTRIFNMLAKNHQVNLRGLSPGRKREKRV